MADDLRTVDRDPETYRPRMEGEQSLARVQGVPWLIVIVLLAAVAWLGWRAFFYQEEGDVVASAALAFEKQNKLIVMNSRFQVVAQSTNTKTILGVPVLESNQAMIVPASVSYTINLSEVDRDRLTWNGETETLDVRLPQLQITKPNIDESKALFFEDGLYVSASTSRSLSSNNSEVATTRAAAFAKNPEVLALAQQAARQAVTQNLAIPLQVAGYGDVKVTVRFDGEQPPAN